MEVSIVVASKLTDIFFAGLGAAITPPMDLYYRENSSAGSVTLGKLSSDIIGKLNQSKPVSLPAGMVTSVDYNNNASNEYTILERTDRNASYQWEEMAPLNEIRNACDGIELLDGQDLFCWRGMEGFGGGFERL